MVHSKIVNSITCGLQIRRHRRCDCCHRQRNRHRRSRHRRLRYANRHRCCRRNSTYCSNDSERCNYPTNGFRNSSASHRNCRWNCCNCHPSDERGACCPTRPCCVSTRIPALTGVTQVRVFGLPSTIIIQSVHRPIAQKTPRGSLRFSVVRNARIPAARSAAATGSPSSAGTGLPSK